jgi:hypothetical protein
LKGLPGDVSLYHYVTPAAHLLVGPMGLWIILPYHQRGEVTYERNRWRLRRGGFMQAYMTVFGQEGIGRPDLEADGQLQAVRKHLAKTMDEASLPPISAVLVFSNDQATLDAADAPLPTIPLRKLKDFFRARTRENSIRGETLLRVKACLPQD